MALSLYLIGAPGAGKSTVFEALTNTPNGPQASSKGHHRLGTVKVPDTRLDHLNTLYSPKKFTPAEVTFVDIGLNPGAQNDRSVSELTTFMGEADAFVLVVQCFGEIDFRGNALDPASQLEAMLLELTVADLDKLERRLDRIAQERQRGTKGQEVEAALLKRCQAHLEAERPLVSFELSATEEKTLRGYRFLSQKRVLVVPNLADADWQSVDLSPLKDVCLAYGHQLMPFCATVEAEIAQLDAEAQAEFLGEYGISEPARTRLVSGAYALLNLISFFTVGEDEVRAWTIPRGTPAPIAAGKIHSDIERGFIRAETAGYSDLERVGTWARCREEGVLRVEGKTYEVQDGDIINFRFNT